MTLPCLRHGQWAFAFGKTGEVQQCEYRVVNLVEFRVAWESITSSQVKRLLIGPEQTGQGRSGRSGRGLVGSS
jgi:hypothetical protein